MDESGESMEPMEEVPLIGLRESDMTHTGWAKKRGHRLNTIILSNINRFKEKFTDRLSNKPFVIWLLTTPPHLKCAATLPCNLSSMACFADINVSQGSV